MSSPDSHAPRSALPVSLSLVARRLHVLRLLAAAAVVGILAGLSALPFDASHRRAGAATAPTVADANLPLAVEIVFDSGRHLGTKVSSVKSTVIEIARALPPTAAIGLANYGPYVSGQLREMEGSTVGLADRVAAISESGDLSSMSAGIQFGIEQFDRNVRGRKLVAIVTDGTDNATSAKPDRLLERAKQAGVHVVVVVPVDLPPLPELSAYRAAGATVLRGVSGDFANAAFSTGTPVDASGAAVEVVPVPKAKSFVQRLFGSPIALLVGGLGVFAAILSIGITLSQPKARKVSLTRPAEAAVSKAAPKASAVSGLAEALSQAADATLKKSGKTNDLDSRLERADLKLKAGEFAVIWVVAIVVMAGLGFLKFGIIGAVPMGVLGAMLPSQLLKQRSKKRSRKFGDQLVDILLLLSSSLRAGQGLVQAFDTVAREGEAPAAEEFHRVVLEARLGRDLVEAMRAMSDRIDCEDIDWVIPAVEINREVGGDLAEVLDTVANTIRDRQDVKRQVKTLSAEGRLSAIVLFLLPIGITGFLYKSNPEYIGDLFKGEGLYLLGVAGILMTIGALWLSKLVKIDY